MTPEGKQLIVVLGMHRSGTSATTRALEVFGVHLGDRLLPAIAGENDKGFYEDIDIYDLNIRMLKAIGDDWHSLAPIASEDVQHLRNLGFFLSAVDLLRRKTAHHRIFGFKDPRVARLLPFWMQVFLQCQFDVSYLLVLRNPLAVAQSLERREGFSHEKSYLLWLGHVITSLLLTKGQRRVLVDFDLLLKDPRETLVTIGEGLSLGIDARAQKEYLSGFLDGELRHNVFSVDDLKADPACPPLVRDIYTALFEFAGDTSQIDAPSLHQLTSRWAEEFEREKPSLLWIDRLLQQIATLEQSADAQNKETINLIKAAITRNQNIFIKTFDADWYLKSNPDVAAAGIDPYYHCITAGMAEGRLPAPSPSNLIRSTFLACSGELINQAEAHKQLASVRTELSAATLDFHTRERQAERNFFERLAALKDELIGAARASETRERALADNVISAAKTSEIRERALAEVRLHAAQVSRDLADRDAQLMQLNQNLAAQNLRVTELTERLGTMSRTASWRITRPIRKLAVWFGSKPVSTEIESSGRRAPDKSTPPIGHTESVEPGGKQGTDQTQIGRTHAMFQSETPVYAANSLTELLQYQAIEFVECAYRTLLKRDPDAQGQQYYLARMLDGTAKIQVLKEISESEEARKIGTSLPGLAGSIRRYRLAQKPFFRVLFELFEIVETNSVSKRRLRAIEQRLYVDGRNLRGHFLGIASDQKKKTAHNALEYADRKTDHSVQTRAGSRLTTKTATMDLDKPLPTADGTWEWSDYDVVKERIRDVKHSRRELFVPEPVEMIDIGGESFVSAAQRVALPAPTLFPDVSIILPVFNNLKLTLECLLSISQHADPSVTFEVLVRDDASTDDTVEVISRIENVRLVRNPENMGFLRNCNRALESVRGKYVVFLNNDTQVSKNWLRTLVGTFSRFRNVGAVGPRFLYPSGHLQEAGAAFRPDATANMIGLNEDPRQMRFSYVRRVDYTSGACLMVPTSLVKELGGFSEEFLPCYCEDSDLCLRIQEKGYFVYCNPQATIVHYLSKTTASFDEEFKYRCAAKNLNTLAAKWMHRLDKTAIPRVLAFYLPQFHPIPENNKWWGEGFTEWTNVAKARPNFEGHYQPRLPADLGYYDLRLPEVMEQQAKLARGSGIDGFCFYYYWFGGKRLLDAPLERMLAQKTPDFPFCLCWANESWSRRWDGRDSEILIAQDHSVEDDIRVIADLSRYFRDQRYIRVDGRPLILVSRVQSFPNFAETAARWRAYCREHGPGDIYIAMIESPDLARSRTYPNVYGCDAAVEFPLQRLAESKPPSGPIINEQFKGAAADFRDLAVNAATREQPPYTRFMGVATGWDNTARMQDNSFCFEYATPGAFQAWLEEAIEQTRAQHYGDERLIFVNAWNEWAEGAYLEPDRRYGRAFLEAVNNAKQAATLLRKEEYGLGG
jgi:GT2 family glycosyltransferase